MAREELLDDVYRELRAIAGRQLRRERANHTLNPTALVHEAYTRLAHREGEFQSTDQLLAAATESMRRILVDHARRRAALKRGGAHRRLSFHDHHPADARREIDVLDLDDLVSRLHTEDPRAARVVELRYFGGLTTERIARILDISPRTVDNDWYFARSWLNQQLAEPREVRP